MQSGDVYPNLAATDHCQVAVATGLVDAGQGGVPVRVFNPTGDPVTIYKGHRLAMFAPVEEARLSTLRRALHRWF